MVLRRQWPCACMQDYYTAQCTNTTLNYEKKQLERLREQLYTQWKTHDKATCRHSLSATLTGSSMAGVMATPATIFGFDPSSSLTVSYPVASGSTPVEELGGGVPIDDDDDDDDTDDSDDEEEEEQSCIIDELLMQDLTDNMSDPLSRSLSCPAASGADTEYSSLMGFVDEDISSLLVFNEPASSASRTAAAAAAAAGAQGMDPISGRLDPHGQRPESSSTARSRTTARSRSCSLTYVEPAQCSLDTETRTRSDTIDIGDWTVASQMTSTTVTQSPSTNVLLHVRTSSSESDDDDAG